MAEKIKLGSTGNWGVKPNGVLAYNDEDSVFKAIELQSSRASGATYVGEDGLIKDAEVGVPRIDWTNGVGELLLEPQSTNLYDYSEDLSLWGGSRVGLDLEADSSLSPDGSLNADLLTEDTSTGSHSIRKLAGPTTTAGLDYSFSFFVKANGRDIVALSNDSGSASANAFFNLTSGTILSSSFDSASMVDYGNGWWRIETTHEATGTDDYDARIYTAIADGSFTHTGDGVSGLYIWGLQVEELSYPTSYIRTEGTTVTRIADAVTGNSSLGQVINSSEGTLYFNFRTLTQIPSASNYVSLSNGTTSDSVFFQFRNDGNLRIYHKALGGSDIAFIVAGNDYSSQYYKAAYTWNNSTNTSNLFVNGVKQTLNGGFVYTDISALDKLSLDIGTSGSDFRGRAREIKVYDTALTDAELTTLTTI